MCEVENKTLLWKGGEKIINRALHWDKISEADLHGFFVEL